MRKELTARSTKLEDGNYSGELAVFSENTSVSYGFRLFAEEGSMEAEIAGITGMVTAPSSSLSLAHTQNKNSALIILAVALGIVNFTLLFRYLRKRR